MSLDAAGGVGRGPARRGDAARTPDASRSATPTVDVGASASPSAPSRRRTSPRRSTTRLGPDSVVLVTGAAGSIVAAITADLARAAGGGTFHLLDLTPEPDPADPDLRQYVEDRDGFKSLLAARMKEQGMRPTPVAIEKELAGYERLAAALTAIDAVQRRRRHGALPLGRPHRRRSGRRR